MSNIMGNYVGGSNIKLNGGSLQDVFNPSTGEVSGQVHLSTSEDLDEVVEVAKRAVSEWSRTPVGMRHKSCFASNVCLRKMPIELPVLSVVSMEKHMMMHWGR